MAKCDCGWFHFAAVSLSEREGDRVLTSVSICHETLWQTVLFHCLVMKQWETQLHMNIYINTNYDYISINTMKMFVVGRFWNRDSIYWYTYKYICCHAHMCIYMHMTCVYMHCVCVVMQYTVAYLNDATSFALCWGLWFISVWRQKKKM